MLGRTEFYALEMLRKRKGTIFSLLPRDVSHYLSSVCYSPNSDIATLLKFIAYGDLPNVKLMLDANPKLVLDAGDVMTPSGVTMKRITPLELALSGGHPDIAKLVDAAFSNINGSAEQKISYQKLKNMQYERYRPHIENMLNQKPYDFTNLFAAIEKNDFEQELGKFRVYIKRGAHATKTVGLQFNYNDELEFFNFYEAYRDRFSYDQSASTCCLVYGLITRNYPAYNRQVAARGLFDVVENKAQMDWTFALKNELMLRFPVTACDDSRTGLGFDYCIVGGARMVGPRPGVQVRWHGSRIMTEKLFKQQQHLLLELMQPRSEPQPREDKPSKCVIC